MAKKTTSSILTGGKSKPSARRSIRCYFCAHSHDVSERTMSTTCPKCNKAIKVEDVVVKSYVPVINLQTCGTITITKRGRVAATRLQASEGVHCEGSVEGSIESGGPTELGSTAVWKGKYLFSPSLTVEDGAQLHGNVTVPAIPQDAVQDIEQNATVSTTRPSETPVPVGDANDDAESLAKAAPPMLTSSTRRPPTPRTITPAPP
ncbi:MAG: polymer-forming cytoskeletal protein, partial [Phycisphaerales bacterium]|nr:polymer-forming cytoskeletal protein [Phycisphaerales bacterium]